ncbi:MAG TPA: hypothetical protein VFA07_10780 [Chthonomonadaceae bacterium]|nr:hypothetical protein [Chthonomonadaceae bacterium]
MQNLRNSFVDSEPSLPVSEMAGLARNWLMDGELSDRSPKTLKSRAYYENLSVEQRLEAVSATIRPFLERAA